MKKLVFLVLAAVVGLSACKDDEDNGDNNGTTAKNKTFMNDVSYSNNSEVDMGQLASSKGTSTFVKSFGNQMVSDHRKAQKELDSIGLKRNYTLATNLKDVDKKTRDSLNALSGAAFDSGYIKVQKMAHTRTINMFQAFRDSTKDTALKTYVIKYLPKVQMHLQRADSIATALKGTGVH